MNQIISLAEVRDRADASRNGSFLARIFELGNEEKRVQYVSPYASNGEGAFIGIPEVGTEVLVCKLSHGDEWYYLGATFTPEPLQVVGPRIPDDNLLPLERAAPLLYRARGEPMAIQLTGREGGGLIVGEDYNPGFINNRTEIRSSVNKRVVLSDSPAISAIVLDSGNGSTIKLGDNPQGGTLPAQSIEVQSVGPQKYISTNSQTDIVVGAGGRELQLVNTASGMEWGPGIPCGNVNIQSKWRDVNVFTQAEEGKIFIECLNTTGVNQVIEIQTNGSGGTIRIKTNGKIDIQASAIGINATQGNINMKAAGKINIEAGLDLSLRSGGTIVADGNPNIKLNEGLSNPATPGIGNTESTYGNEGVTTY